LPGRVRVPADLWNRARRGWVPDRLCPKAWQRRATRDPVTWDTDPRAMGEAVDGRGFERRASVAGRSRRALTLVGVLALLSVLLVALAGGPHSPTSAIRRPRPNRHPTTTTPPTHAHDGPSARDDGPTDPTTTVPGEPTTEPDTTTTEPSTTTTYRPGAARSFDPGEALQARPELRRCRRTARARRPGATGHDAYALVARSGRPRPSVASCEGRARPGPLVDRPR